MTIYKSRSFFVLGVNELSGDSVEGTSAFIGDDSSIDLKLVSLLILLDDFLLLQLLETPSDDLQVGVLVSGVSAGNSVFLAIQVGQQVHSGSRSQVDFSSEGSHSHVDPVVIEGGEFGG